MSIEFYPNHKHILSQFKHICGQHTGIMESQIVMQANSNLSRNITLCTAMMPNYHKVLYGDDAEVSYHLSGYGIYKEESLIRLLGEGIERYGLFTTHFYHQHREIYLSYNELCEKYPDQVIDWNYIHLYESDDYEKMKDQTFLVDITKDDKISWVLCPSIFDETQSYYIPAQMMFVGYKANPNRSEKWFTPGFSKGTATHGTVEKAFKGAIGEIIESDALMIKWYSDPKAYEVVIDDFDLMQLLHQITANTGYDVVIYDYTVQKELGYVFAAALINQKEETPYIVMGCSSGFDALKAIYRAVMEALAILYLAINGPVVMPKDYLEVTHERSHVNLDSNVSYWASLEDAQMKKEYLASIIKGQKPVSTYINPHQNSNEELKAYIEGLKAISKYAVYTDMTPVEINDVGFKVMRVFIPELVQMSFPGMPYSKHPRVLAHGGINNDLPHPLP